MNAPRLHHIVVLKFGGSVLRDPESCTTAVHEIYRFVREGRKVVAVCSAFRGETDRLEATAHRVGSDASPSLRAALLQTGELQSAAVLAIAAEAAGLACRLLTPDQVALRTTGPSDDADPLSVNDGSIHEALASVDVVVVPGFTGRDAGGNATLLGRGGSDLTALFIANRLGAECRLIKDVRGWYDGERVLSHLSLTDAEVRSGRVVQRKAARFAAATNTSFTLGAAGSPSWTTVSVAPERGAEIDVQEPRARTRVAILGVGTVGAGVWHRLARQTADFEIVGGLVSDRDMERESWIDRSLLRTSYDTLPDHDVAVDALPTAGAARSAVATALRRGRCVASANKALVALHGAELEALAEASGCRLLYSAAAGGACPVIETAFRVRSNTTPIRVRGILNATTNVVLDAVSAGSSLEEAVASAQRRGFAEADPATDLSGDDARHKLVLIARALTGRWFPVNTFATDPITEQALRTHRRKTGCRLRHVAELTVHPPTRRSPLQVAGAVKLASVSPTDELFDVAGPSNAAFFDAGDGTRGRALGLGAGRWPTAESVVADLYQLRRTLEQQTSLQVAS